MFWKLCYASVPGEQIHPWVDEGIAQSKYSKIKSLNLFEVYVLYSEVI